ncbi:MAG TPA: sulfurtransferase TusA family protein [Actinomycetota bacterium]
MTEQRVVIDCLGHACPIPVLRLAKAAEEASPGTLIELLSDDAAAKVDIPVWTRMKHQEFVGREDRARGWAFLVRVIG